MLYYSLLFCVSLLCVSCASGDSSSEGIEPFVVRVRNSIEEPIFKEVHLSAKTEANRSIRLKAQTGGKVISLKVTKGSFVSQGELLAVIDIEDRGYKVSSAKSLVEKRKVEYEASLELFNKGYESQVQLASAQQNLKDAISQEAAVGIELKYTQIVAPISGVLDKLEIEEGDVLEPGDLLGTLLELDPIIVAAYVPGSDIMNIKQGITGTVFFDDSEHGEEGLVTYIARESESVIRTYRVELELNNKGLLLPSGVTCSLVLPYEQVNAHLIPLSLLSLDKDEKLGVKWVDSDNKVCFSPVSIVRAQKDSLWVLGLPDRLNVIVLGQGFVAVGDTVRSVLVEDK